MKSAFLIRKKGFNFYGDYIELYMHRVFEHKGYHLVKDRSKALFAVVVYAADGEKYMTAVSPYFDTMSDEELSEMTELLCAEFKSEVIAMPQIHAEFCGEVHVCMFSDLYNAFEEPPFVADGAPEFTEYMHDAVCKNGSRYLAGYTNYGGAVRGIAVDITFIEDVDIEDAALIYYEGKNSVEKLFCVSKTASGFTLTAPDFEMKEGINKYSAALRGKKYADECERHGFYIRFVPIIKNADTSAVEITVKA
ncbi:MAG: hypothetical protein IJ002_03320 [Clostridia bacterium]|nr:hypothetical protein [Clostridia bacterium]